MRHASQIAIAVAATMVFEAATVLAQSAGTEPGHGAAGHGPMMSQGMAHGMDTAWDTAPVPAAVVQWLVPRQC